MFVIIGQQYVISDIYGIPVVVRKRTSAGPRGASGERVKRATLVQREASTTQVRVQLPATAVV